MTLDLGAWGVGQREISCHTLRYVNFLLFKHFLILRGNYYDQYNNDSKLRKHTGIMTMDVASYLEVYISNRMLRPFANVTDPWLPHLKKMEVIRPVLHPRVLESLRRG